MSETTVQLFSLDNPAEVAAWDAYVARHDTSRGYYGTTWLAAIRTAFEHEAFLLAATRHGEICGILPLTLVISAFFGRFFVSVPFVNYGGILADDQEAARRLLHKAHALCEEYDARSVELRHLAPSPFALPARTDKASAILDLTGGPDVLWSHFSETLRTQIETAQNSPLRVVSGGKELLDDFYRIFCVNMRDLGTPVYGKHFFAILLDTMPESTRISCIRFRSQYVAAGITYGYGDTFQVPWASSLPHFRHLCPNHLLYWQAIRDACAQGYACFDFGRSSRDSAPWRFKQEWGARELPLHWEYILMQGVSLADMQANNPMYRMTVEVWKRMPLFFANMLGPRSKRDLP